MIDFPNSPTLNQIFTGGTPAASWRWDGAKWVVSGAATATMIVVNNTTTLTTGFVGIVRAENTTSAPITITLPASPTAGQEITIKDMLGNAGTYPITISGGATTIEGVTSLVLSYNYSWASVIAVPIAAGGMQWVQT